MALKPPTQAPDFTLASTSGSDFTLSKDFAGKPCIIYFYPKDFTSTCTAEACDFRDNIGFFRNLGIDVVGISRDTVETHLKFKEENKLTFELLADTKGKVAGDFGALVPLIGITRRVTFLLDKDHKVFATYENFFQSAVHIKEMIEQVKKMEN